MCLAHEISLAVYIGRVNQIVPRQLPCSLESKTTFCPIFSMFSQVVERKDAFVSVATQHGDHCKGLQHNVGLTSPGPHRCFKVRICRLHGLFCVLLVEVGCHCYDRTIRFVWTFAVKHEWRCYFNEFYWHNTGKWRRIFFTQYWSRGHLQQIWCLLQCMCQHCWRT